MSPEHDFILPPAPMADAAEVADPRNIYDISWQADARCRDVGWAGSDEGFFSGFDFDEDPLTVSPSYDTRAQREWVIESFCHRCPVEQVCGDFGRATGSIGIWGGRILKYHSKRQATQ